jgi:hypothetical protein
MIDPPDALCCLIGAAAQAAEDHGAAPFDHRYPTATMTWPYCAHHAVIGRALPPTTLPPPGYEPGVPQDLPGVVTVLYHRFEVAVVRCGPPAPELAPGQCLGALYGDCDSEPGHDTLAGHERAVTAEREWLTAGLLDLWCACLAGVDPGTGRPRYPAHAPRWIESVTVETGGRFTATTFTVATRLG